jgi:dimethylaniline monooxygenase (N-oxide forming)
VCTGYDLDFPFLPPLLSPWTSTAGSLYRLVFPPDHPTLAFIGVCRVHGPIFPIVEMQARWVAQVLTGRTHLPTPAIMRTEIAARLAIQAARNDSPIRVGLIPYLDEVGGMIGVQPRLWRHPRLLRPLLTGPPMAAQYRLDGPGRWAGAAEVIEAGS